MEKPIAVYLAGPLFGIADRHHNVLLARQLRALGYRVVLPQEEAVKFFNGQDFNLSAIIKDCMRQAMDNDVIVANIDGPDADSGTSLEVGLALASLSLAGNKPRVICVRTDFRTHQDTEVGLNAMFWLADKVIYAPAFVNTSKEVKLFYRRLAKEIDQTIRTLFSVRG